ncbi:topoisomerase IV subunit A [Liquorilactobacillus sucicola DSM 21376 = JCM 15457]|uniref:DNA topoisomerase 4 subunit A n=1 Tax=Liquorilactobacillus sucicola DSM 21376 = JCM 15457 TaxID=1423806 RepID=A0A023CVK8_9LACO|nr:DNA topoisomerase IV subunit A [Liquorilactobacillus sucicola]KRN05488.1 DNA topoisomerase IV subunit A [Liquorilactobacillus sucicola DSM 21376 = JCM 15457]GAJ25570.1 topoisomerase IV subunit A [Liquorilactobacillus sucicola DSM 21376 = JCM 15457]
MVENQEENSNVQELSLEAVMGERFGRYSKYIIQERALPDIRDGLKPVQRRILYAMNQDGNTYDKAFRKSAKSVGNVMGNFHPHGDSSIYEAMVRLSQSWKLREPLIEMHGNNGSMDGDPPAAMRYTEARLSKISGEMLRDIEKETVEFVPNFDDTENEPTVLPARFPNLLVNGATGISAGYATEIPPHNLHEAIQAVIYLMEHPKAKLDKLMEFVKGPDFPTGGIAQGIDGIVKAYTTGRGRVMLRSKTEIEQLKGNKEQIIVTEIPYEVNKALLVKKIDELRLLKKVEGISEVRDESDREGLRIVIELKRNASGQGILNYLFKNTDLQISYNFNMVAINNKRPEHVGLKAILSAYLEHQRTVTTKRTQFDLRKAQERKHIVSGLIKALSILDQVIKTIRASKNKKDAKENLVAQYDFTEAQAEAIVSLQLYRLTNTDVTALQAEFEDLQQKVKNYQEILADPGKLDKVIKKELRAIDKQYVSPRKTVIQDHVQQLKIETEVLVAPEDVVVMVSRDGYLKRSSLRSFKASGEADNGLKSDDLVIFQSTVNTLDHLFIMTDKGNVIYRPVHEIPEYKWKDTGKHLSQTVSLDKDEKVIHAFSFHDLKQTGNFLFASREGFIKQTTFADLRPGRTYRSRAAQCMKLKTNSDRLLTVAYLPEEDVKKDTLFILALTHGGYGLRYKLNEVPVNGAKAAGVKAIDLREDVLAAVLIVDEKSQVGILTQRGAFKRMKVSEITATARARRGVQILRELKRNPHRVILSRVLKTGENLSVITDKMETIVINPFDHPNVDRYSNGSFIIDTDELGVPLYIKMQISDGESEN